MAAGADPAESARASASGPELLALDFDGVICDSARESGLTTWNAARTTWSLGTEAPPPEFLAAYARLRPIIESGWENLVIARLLLDGVTEETIATDFQTVQCPGTLARYGLEKADLIRGFAAARDGWLAADPDGWLAVQDFYPGVAARLRTLVEAGPPTYVITTKQQRFAATLLARHGVELPSSRILGLETGPKEDSLARLAQEHGLEPAAVWFVEDRLATLARVDGVAALAGVRLFLADWGYNTPAERAAASAVESVQVLTREQFLGPFAAWPDPGA